MAKIRKPSKTMYFNGFPLCFGRQHKANQLISIEIHGFGRNSDSSHTLAYPNFDIHLSKPTRSNPKFPGISTTVRLGWYRAGYEKTGKPQGFLWMWRLAGCEAGPVVAKPTRPSGITVLWVLPGALVEEHLLNLPWPCVVFLARFWSLDFTGFHRIARLTTFESQ